MSSVVGPGTIDCAEKCEVPEGVRVTEVPQPRHKWGDVHGCPKPDCGRWFLATKTEEVQ